MSTRTLFEQSEAGASREELAVDFGLTSAEVRRAFSYERERDAASAA